MTTQDKPAVGPLSADDVKLLVKGDVISHPKWGVSTYLPETNERPAGLVGPWSFIGRPGPDGWIWWRGGPNPVPGITVEAMWHDRGVQKTKIDKSEMFGWGTTDCDPIIGFRLAPTAPVETLGETTAFWGNVVTDKDERGPGGYLVKDFADGWYWTPDATLEEISGAPVWSVEHSRFETDRLPTQPDTAPVETLGETAAFWGNVVTGAECAETLHPATADLVDRFAAELKSKLAKAEAKYGYRDDWSKPDWKDDLIESLAEHVQKGDPRDVAAYCAFAWHHGWSTSEVPDCFHRAPRPTDVVQALEPFAKAARMAGINSHNKPNLEQEAKRAVSWLDFSRAAKAIELATTQPDTGKVEASGVEREALWWAAKALVDNINEFGTVTDDVFVNNLDAALATALRPQPSGETREKVARIVDPLVFELINALENAEGEPEQLRNDATKHKDERLSVALAKADRILALITPAKGGGK